MTKKTEKNLPSVDQDVPSKELTKIDLAQVDFIAVNRNPKLRVFKNVMVFFGRIFNCQKRL